VTLRGLQPDLSGFFRGSVTVDGHAGDMGYAGYAGDVDDTAPCAATRGRLSVAERCHPALRRDAIGDMAPVRMTPAGRRSSSVEISLSHA
jgi:hypothetical protein